MLFFSEQTQKYIIINYMNGSFDLFLTFKTFYRFCFVGEGGDKPNLVSNNQLERINSLKTPQQLY